MRPIKKGTTDVSVIVRVIDSEDGTPETGVAYDTAGVDLWYRREGAAAQPISEATLASASASHSPGGFIHIEDGYCRLDLPDAACASGANGVMVGGAFTGMIVIGTYVPLVDYDPYDSVRMGMTALPNAAADAAGGLPISDNGELDLDTMNSNVSDILTDTGTTLQSGLNDIQTDTEDIQSRLPAALVSGRMSSDAVAISGSTTAADNVEANIGNLDEAISGLNDISAADVNTQCDAALADYDPPTNTEMTAAFTEIKGATWSSSTDTLEDIRDKQTDIEADTQDIQTQVGTDGAGLTNIPWNSDWDAEVQSECTDALNAYDPPTNTEMTTAFTEIKGATWASGTDTLEHIRNKLTDIETDTQDLQTQIGTDGDGLTGIPWNGSWDAEVQSEVEDALKNASIGSLSMDLVSLIEDTYQMTNNKMTVNESTGAVALRNIGDTANIATGSVTSSSGTTTRAELSWV